MVNYYKTLGLSITATQDEIRKAYRKLAKQYHPDANPGNEKAEQLFKAVAEAYTVLSDEVKRNEYDRKFTEVPPVAKNKSGTKSRRQADMSGAEFFGSNMAFEKFFGFDPNSDESVVNKDESLKPMKTKDAFRTIFGDNMKF